MLSRMPQRTLGLSIALGLGSLSLLSVWAFQSNAAVKKGIEAGQDITKNGAGRIAVQFLGKVKGSALVQGIDQNIMEGPIPNTYQIVLGKRFNLSISRQTGAVIGFVDTTLDFERYQNKGRTGRYALTTKEQTETYLWALARRIGIPPDTRMDSLTLTFDGQGGSEVSAGNAGCRILKTPNGYPILDEFVGMTFHIDPQDKALIVFTQRWDYATIAKPAFKITKAQALDAARKKSKAMTGALEAQLGYARDLASPNKGVAKLYWGVRRKGADLWPVLVDAVTGVARERF